MKNDRFNPSSRMAGAFKRPSKLKMFYWSYSDRIIAALLTVAIVLLVFICRAEGQAPELSNFEAQMRTYGLKHCDFLKSNALPDPKLAATYYDAAHVFYQIADYTKDGAWINCANLAHKVYRDSYVIPNNGTVPGYWIFTHGLLRDVNNSESKRALLMLANNGSYAPETTPPAWTADSTMSREVAYNIMSMIDAEKAGRAMTPRYELLVNQAFGHMDQWFVSRTAPYIRPFMVALTAEALILNHERKPDARTLPALESAAAHLWLNLWLPERKSFKYTNKIIDPGDTNPAPDLNLLVAPMYAWIYKETGDTRYRDRADQIFAGGVSQAYLVNAKQFNQNYRWGFSYLKWRDVNIDSCETLPVPATQACTNHFLKQIRDLLQ